MYYICVTFLLAQGTIIIFLLSITGAFSVLLHEYPRVFEQSMHNPWCFLSYKDVNRPPAQWENVRAYR